MLLYAANGDDIRCLLLPQCQFLHPLVLPLHLCPGNYLAASHPLQQEAIFQIFKKHSRFRAWPQCKHAHAPLGLLECAVHSKHCCSGHQQMHVTPIGVSKSISILWLLGYQAKHEAEDFPCMQRHVDVSVGDTHTSSIQSEHTWSIKLGLLDRTSSLKGSCDFIAALAACHTFWSSTRHANR